MTPSSKSSDKPVKVLHTIYSLEAGGAERVVYHYALYHRKNNYVPVVCAIKKGGEFAEEIRKHGVKVYLATEKNSGPFDIIKKIRQIIIEENISVVHSHGQVANSWTIPAVFFSPVRCFVRTEHNVYYPGFKAKIHSFINRSTFFLNDRIIGVSDAVKNAHIDTAFAGRSKYITVHNGIDRHPFEDVKVEREKMLKDIGISDNCLIVGTVGSLTRQKRQDVFLRAMAEVCEKVKNVRGMIVGKGGLADELLTLSKELHIDDKVSFCGLRTDIPEILNLMDVFVLSSDWEGFPISLLEAMASGCPNVVTDVGGNREAVEDGISGFLVPPDNPSLLAEKICTILQNKEVLKNTGNNARQYFLENFTAEKMVIKTEEIYSQVILEKNSGRDKANS